MSPIDKDLLAERVLAVERDLARIAEIGCDECGGYHPTRTPRRPVRGSVQPMTRPKFGP